MVQSHAFFCFYLSAVLLLENERFTCMGAHIYLPRRTKIDPDLVHLGSIWARSGVQGPPLITKSILIGPKSGSIWARTPLDHKIDSDWTQIWFNLMPFFASIFQQCCFLKMSVLPAWELIFTSPGGPKLTQIWSILGRSGPGLGSKDPP